MVTDSVTNEKKKQRTRMCDVQRAAANATDICAKPLGPTRSTGRQVAAAISKLLNLSRSHPE